MAGRARDNVIWSASTPATGVPLFCRARWGATGGARPDPRSACGRRGEVADLQEKFSAAFVRPRPADRGARRPVPARAAGACPPRFRRFHDFALFESWCDHNPCLFVYSAEISPLCLRRPAGLLTLPPKHGWRLERPPVPDPGGRLFLPAARPTRLPAFSPSTPVAPEGRRLAPRRPRWSLVVGVRSDISAPPDRTARPGRLLARPPCAHPCPSSARCARHDPVRGP